MRVLITGAGGQLGRDLQAVLRDEEVDARDHRALDIGNEAAVLAAVEEVRPQWVINAAAFNDVDAAEIAEDEAYAINARGPANLAGAAAAVDAGLIHISSDYVFDGTKGSAYTEDDRPNPLSVYGRSKYQGERAVLESGASVCVLRTAWLYGVLGKNFVKSILERAKEGTPLFVVADQVGSPTSTRDLAEAINQMIRTPARGLFHVANAGACSRFEFAKAIVRGAVEVRPITSAEAGRRAPRPANTALTSLRWEAMGLEPLRSWEAALTDFLESYSRRSRK
jgi:dTDP-4-dehydrorhamnose reductase